jgi:hypothetical protein
MRCEAGCASCCARFSITPAEAALVADALDALDPDLRAAVAARAHEPSSACPALGLDGRCVVYSARPAICRTHGLPLGLDEGDARVGERRRLRVVSSCELNFTGGVDGVARADVLDQERLSAVLAAVAQAFEREGGAPAGARVAIADLCARG